MWNQLIKDGGSFVVPKEDFDDSKYKNTHPIIVIADVESVGSYIYPASPEEHLTRSDNNSAKINSGRHSLFTNIGPVMPGLWYSYLCVSGPGLPDPRCYPLSTVFLIPAAKTDRFQQPFAAPCLQKLPWGASSTCVDVDSCCAVAYPLSSYPQENSNVWINKWIEAAKDVIFSDHIGITWNVAGPSGSVFLCDNGDSDYMNLKAAEALTGESSGASGVQTQGVELKISLTTASNIVDGIRVEIWKKIEKLDEH